MSTGQGGKRAKRQGDIHTFPRVWLERRKLEKRLRHGHRTLQRFNGKRR